MSEGELETLAEVGEESIAETFIGQSTINTSGVIVRSKNQEFSKERSCMHLRSTPVKTLIWKGDEISAGISSDESPLKLSAGVVFKRKEQDEVLCDKQSFERRRNSNTGKDCILALSNGGLTTEIGLSEVYVMVVQTMSTGRVGMPLWSGISLVFAVLRREKLSANGILSHRSMYYPSQSAKTLLKDFFVSNPHTLLDPGHTKINLSADQMIQFARAVGLAVALASLGLLEDLLFRARGCGPVDVCGPFGKLPYHIVIGTTVRDNAGS